MKTPKTVAPIKFLLLMFTLTVGSSAYSQEFCSGIFSSKSNIVIFPTQAEIITRKEAAIKKNNKNLLIMEEFENIAMTLSEIKVHLKNKNQTELSRSAEDLNILFAFNLHLMDLLSATAKSEKIPFTSSDQKQVSEISKEIHSLLRSREFSKWISKNLDLNKEDHLRMTQLLLKQLSQLGEALNTNFQIDSQKIIHFTNKHSSLPAYSSLVDTQIIPLFLNIIKSYELVAEFNPTITSMNKKRETNDYLLYLALKKFETDISTYLHFTETLLKSETPKELLPADSLILSYTELRRIMQTSPFISLLNYGETNTYKPLETISSDLRRFPLRFQSVLKSLESPNSKPFEVVQ